MHIGTLAHWREAARASAHIGSRRRACTEAGRSVGGSGGGENAGGRGRGGVADARAPRQASAPSAGAAARLLYWKMFARSARPRGRSLHPHRSSPS
ncbi:unnamed protein product [Prorocentrum cordatum]|uniref:Uncharacterized protein n=1 Tax=Prorocentrum cordatum TaxID=2364126 RepID=A0ABN9PHJ9_9DINO|nr:unnamed protein product [Polarella glacialis]